LGIESPGPVLVNNQRIEMDILPALRTLLDAVCPEILVVKIIEFQVDGCPMPC